MQSVEDKIIARIRGHGTGYAFSGKDFLDLASRYSVDKALSELTRSGVIRRVCRGLYDYPRVNPELGGELSPDVQAVAKALARKNGVMIQPTGAVAANQLGLSNQVPARVVFLTNGKSRTLLIDNREVRLNRVAPKELQPGSEIGVLVTQALRYLGKKHVGKPEITHLQRCLSKKDKARLRRDARYMEDWIWSVVQQITDVIDDNKSKA